MKLLAVEKKGTMRSVSSKNSVFHSSATDSGPTQPVVETCEGTQQYVIGRDLRLSDYSAGLATAVETDRPDLVEPRPACEGLGLSKIVLGDIELAAGRH